MRLNTVSWHVKTKARLLELMADAILADVSLADLPDEWRARLRELAHRYPAALLGVRDGARVVAGTYAAEENTLRLGEAFLACLLDGGLADREAVWTSWTIITSSSAWPRRNRARRAWSPRCSPRRCHRARTPR